MGCLHDPQVGVGCAPEEQGKHGYPPMRETVYDARSGESLGMGPSGMASRAAESGREEDEPAGDDGLILYRFLSSSGDQSIL